MRGFRENYISGDSGYQIRNKVSFSPGYNLTFEPFYDYGYAEYHNARSRGRLSGAGIKTIFNTKYFSAAVTYSKALSHSKLSVLSSSTGKKEDQMVYFELSANCC